MEYGVIPLGSSRLEVVCNDLITRAQSQNYAIDVYVLEAVIERLLNDPQIDLLCVFPSSYSTESFEFDHVIELIGSHSHVFKALLDGSCELFEYFISSFCRHLERSSCTLETKLVESSVYMQLLSEYVCYMMPTNEESPTITHDLSSLSPSTSTFSTPLNLFREDFLRRYALSPSSHSLKALKSFSRSLSPHFLSFICVIVRSYCSLSSWPSDYRLIALRFVLKELHCFVLAETESISLNQVKTQLQCNAPFTDSLIAFFLSLFNKWPANSSFNNLFDVWVTWVRPWRYLPIRGSNDVQRLMPFVLANRIFYIDVSDAFWRRRFPVKHPDDVKFIENYISILISPELVAVYDALEYDVGQRILIFRQSLKASALDLQEFAIQEKVKLSNTNWIRRLFFADDTQFRIYEAEQTSSLLEILGSKIDAAVVGGLQNLDLVLNDHDRSSSFIERMSPSRFDKVPEHYLHPSTRNIHLTPTGRRQVLSSSCRFITSEQYPYYSKSMLGWLQSDEIWWLARILYMFSKFLNETSICAILSDSYYDYHSLTGIVARLFLDTDPPQQISSLNSRRISRKPFFNLRYFAKYRFVVPSCVFVIFCHIIPLSYSLLIFCSLLAYARFL